MCCGNNRATISQPGTTQSSARARARQPITLAYFEYRGKTAMTVTGPVTGARYRFPMSGSRVAVDLRDRKSVAAIPQLVQVNSL